MDDPHEIDVQHLAPELRRNRLERQIGLGHAGVVDQYIHPSPTRAYLFDGRAHLPRVTDIHPCRQYAQAARIQDRGLGQGRIAIDIQQHHPEALAMQQPGGLEAYATAGAGDDGDFFN